MLALSTGRKPEAVPEPVADMTARQIQGHAETHFEAPKRLLDRDEPDDTA